MPSASETGPENVCRCIQCYRYRYVDPATQIPSPGRVFTAEDFKNHRRKLAQAHVCLCRECLTHQYVDPTSGVQCPGKLFSAEKYRDHQREAKRLQHASEMLSEASDRDASDGNMAAFWSDGEPPPDSAGREGSGGEESDASSNSQGSIGDMGRNSYSDDFSMDLRSHIERLAAWEEIVESLAGTDFVFIAETPSATEAGCVLDPNTPNPALSYQEFLSECSSFIKQGAQSPLRRHRLLAKICKKLWQPASEGFEALKAAKFRHRGEVNAIHVGESLEAPCLLHLSRNLNAGETQRFRNWEPVQFICILLAATMHIISQISIPRSASLSFMLRLALTGQLSVPRSAFLLSMLRLVLVAVFKTFAISDSRSDAILNGIPSDVRTATRRLDIDPETTTFACCPKCYALYDVPPDGQSPKTPKCTRVEFSGDRGCGRNLFHTKAGHYVPTRQYVYQDLKLWLKRLYSRPDIEEMLDRHIDVETEVVEMKDIWDGSVLRNFKGTDGKHFLDGNGEGRLVFGINQDGANPYGNRTAGKKVSIGPIYLVCLNLPPKVRYRMENIFIVGIIPGPKEPSGAEINHLLRPLVDDLKEAWEHGFFLVRTARQIFGRRVRCALVPIIADLPASRQLSGLGSFRSTDWCSECHLPIQERNNLDKLTWVARTWEEHSQRVADWRSCKSKAERDQQYDAHHVRFSELLRLPYWDPTKFITIDTMHAFYLGLFHRHVRTIWGMDVSIDDGLDKSSQRSNYVPTAQDIQAVHIELQVNPEAKQMEQKRTLFLSLREHFNNFPLTVPIDPVSEPLAADPMPDTIPAPSPSTTSLRNRHQSGTTTPTPSFLSGDEKRKDLGLVDRDTGRLVPKSVAPGMNALPKVPKRRTTVLLGPKILQEVRSDMERRSMPSNVGRAPTHPGEAAWGKFTADQWKTFCIYHLPFTLSRLWGPYKDSKDAEHRRKYEMLQNFLHLVSAVKSATLPTVTPATIRAYEKEILSYLSGLLTLYPGAQIESYQHLAMHFGDLLKRWGPTHSWRCFAFERYNGLLQKINTSKKFGEMEATMLKTFCRRQNLTALYSPSILPPIFREAATAFQQYFNYDNRGTWAADTGAGGSPATTTPTIYPVERPEAIPSRLLAPLNEWVSRYDPGADYDHSAHFANEAKSSQLKFVVLLAIDGRVGFIRNIFLHTRRQGEKDTKEVFVVVACLQELSPDHAKLDHFRENSFASGRLVYNNTDRTAVYSLSQISHCFLTPTKLKSIPSNYKLRHALPIQPDLHIESGELAEFEPVI
ncbi:hypothetical protein MVEN_01840000 [Mycena venus]|uniref:DUF4218 domain-containing protein n=1 Tax=Mycena venus TaxID=2733690 RepID=A0A8H6XL81_9AGAR|nr:hypothetical protein MVEN_01840000 [Mycena venus]